MKIAILLGSGPEFYRQKKMNEMYDFLISAEGGFYEPGNIIVFPNGVSELLLESVLNEAFDKASDTDAETNINAETASGDGECGQVFLYFCARTEEDLHSLLSDCAVAGVEAIRLGKDEIRKEIIHYYKEKLARMYEVELVVEYDFDGEFVSEEELGWESVEA